jgi:two-component system, sensor histidine kinase RegB
MTLTSAHHPHAAGESVREVGPVEAYPWRSDSSPTPPLQDRATSVLRMRTMVNLRWVTIAGQTATVLASLLFLRLPIPYPSLFLLIGLAAVLNTAIWLSPAINRSIRNWGLTAQLGFDIVELCGLLYLTGGLMNPFCLFLIAPVTLGASSLPPSRGLFLGLLAVGLTVAMAAFPPASHLTAQIAIPLLQIAGHALALVVAMSFSGLYAWSASGEEARMRLALHVAETVLAREQRLSALGGLAAAAAHELGTPLATISVVAKELARETAEGPLHEDALLLVSQAQRCRDILRRLADAPDAGDELHERMSLLQFVAEVLKPYATDGPVRAEALVTGPRGMAAPDLWRRPEVLHAITSIIENAFDFARAEILVTARFDAHSIVIEVRDDGPGFAADVLAKLGDPYVTSRPAAEGSRTGHVGMGLGFFIAKTLLERTGAEVGARNGRKTGAIVTVRWPRSLMEALEPGVDALEIPPQQAIIHSGGKKTKNGKVPPEPGGAVHA